MKSLKLGKYSIELGPEELKLLFPDDLVQSLSYRGGPARENSDKRHGPKSSDSVQNEIVTRDNYTSLGQIVTVTAKPTI